MHPGLPCDGQGAVACRLICRTGAGHLNGIHGRQGGVCFRPVIVGHVIRMGTARLAHGVPGTRIPETRREIVGTAVPGLMVLQHRIDHHPDLGGRKGQQHEQHHHGHQLADASQPRFGRRAPPRQPQAAQHHQQPDQQEAGQLQVVPAQQGGQHHHRGRQRPQQLERSQADQQHEEEVVQPPA